MPDVLRTNPLFEIVPCRFSPDEQTFFVDLKRFDGQKVACPVSLTEQDAVLLLYGADSKSAVAVAVDQAASVYLVADGLTKQVLDADMQQWVAGIVPKAHVEDFWLTGWAVREQV